MALQITSGGSGGGSGGGGHLVLGAEVSGVFNKPANAASKRIYDHVVQSVPRGIMGSS